MSTETRDIVARRRQARLVMSSRSRQAVRDLSPHALHLMRGAYLEPCTDTATARWEHRSHIGLARCRAAIRLVPAARCLTHASAAQVLDLSLWSDDPDVSVATATTPRRASTRLPIFRVPPRGLPHPIDAPTYDARQVHLLRRRLTLEAGEVVVSGGLPVTSALRTAFDCACDELPYDALAVADAALRRYCQADRRRPEAARPLWQQARETWSAMITRHPGRRGVAQARAVLAAASPWSESPGESLVRWLVLVLGLPAPTLQYGVDLATGRRYLDLCWPDLRIVIEFDGEDKYREPQDTWREKNRQDAIHEQGWNFLRITSADLGDLHLLAERVLGLFPPVVVADLHPAVALDGARFWGHGLPQAIVR